MEEIGDIRRVDEGQGRVIEKGLGKLRKDRVLVQEALVRKEGNDCWQREVECGGAMFE